MNGLDKGSAPAEDVDTLYRRYIVMVRGRAGRILGNTAVAEEVAQEVFIRFLKRRRKGKDEQNPGGLLYRMATNLALNTLRDAKRRRELLQEHGSVLAGVDALAPAECLALRQCLSRVPREEARIASYYYLDGMEQEEIADLLAMPRRTVGRRLDKFRKRARSLLEADRQRGNS